MPCRPAPANVAAAAERLASEAERLATLVSALAKAARLVPPPLEPVAPAPVIVPPPEPSAEERLRHFAARHAVFFSSGTDFLQPAETARILDEAAERIKAAAGTLVRVVG
jgi:outer membrane protein OmpA-like peptidoglycan-associated protein